MGALKQAKNLNTAEINLINGDSYVLDSPYEPSVNHGLPTLIVMVVVLVIIMLFCFWGAPAVRAFCKRKICCCCPMDEPNTENVSTADGSASPTIILLPYGRMLVVDRNVFAQLQADHTGIDFMELSANLIRAQNIQNASNPSILESENTSKGLSPTSLDFLPPAYEDIFGIKNSDLPPSYSEISLMFRKLSREKLNAVRVSDKEIDITPIPQESILRTSFSAPFILNDQGLFNFEHRMRHAFVSLENNLERNLSNCSEEEGCANLSVEFIRSGENAQACNLQLNDRCEATNDDNVNVMEYIDRESSV